jgi:transposase InsO family protein
VRFASLNLTDIQSPEEFPRTMQQFIEYYNYRRYHEAIGTEASGRVL